MKLITLAHHGEAQAIIEKFNLKKVSIDIFKNDELVVLITGEGPFEAAIKTALAIPKFSVTEIINLGIAGSLKQDIPVGQIIEVRTLYLVNGQRPSFKTFQSFEKGHDCLTTFERILDPEKANFLRGLGHIVDREAWGVAMAAKTAGVPFKSFKIISDFAGSINSCELIKEDSWEFSKRLSEVLYLELHKKSAPTGSFQFPEGLYFTFTTENQFKTLLKKITLKSNLSTDEVLTSLNLEGLKDLEISPKEKTKILIQRMEEMINPFKKNISIVINEIMTSFKNKGFKVNIDPELENTKLTVSFEVSSDQELLEKSDSLKNLSINNFSRLMKGDISVE